MVFLMTKNSYPQPQDHFTEKRKAMITTQIKARGVKDSRVLAALQKVERHLFVPSRAQDLAYEDFPLPIGEGQTISQPYIVALMTELLNLQGSEKVLEIGTGSGYQTAVLGELAKEVYSVELVESLATQAQESLGRLGYTNIFVLCGDGFKGWVDHAPYDAIIVTCAPDKIPQTLVDQLSENGRMVIPVGTAHQELILIRKERGKLFQESIIPVSFVPMVPQKE
jgi:protein-L-isoaspartate(D-aspartate) O-methyltransferase